MFELSAKAIDGRTMPLSLYRGQVILVVNTASLCGLTPQYRGLEQLWRTYRDQGLVVLGFPCNQFGRQEPGKNAHIAETCRLNYDVTFPLFEKINVNGAGTHPLYAWLKAKAPGLLGTQRIKWNFTKFLVSRDGQTVRRFKPSTPANALRGPIERCLGEDVRLTLSLADQLRRPTL
ncbi:MAG: glutathione peroxidase [Myxococcota bacterium]|nr:glutathione peroxidase [Myxococcota bacterium]